MDDFFIYLVLGIIYLIFQALTASKKKKGKKPLPPTGTPRPTTTQPKMQPGAEPTLEDALREIRQALGMETPAQRPTPPPTTTPPSLPSPQRAKTPAHPIRTHAPELAETAPKKSWSSEFKRATTHYADETFEELLTDGDRFGERRQTPPVRHPDSSSRSTTKKKNQEDTALPAASRKTSPGTIALHLKDPDAARNAFVMGEILGPPRAHRRR